MPDPLAITVYSDVICPWCYVGKRRLEAALGSPGVPAQVNFSWRPFELNPDMPAEGIERSVYRAQQVRRGAQRQARPADGRDRPRGGDRFRFRPHAMHAQHAPGASPDLGGRAAGVPRAPSSIACSAPISRKGSTSDRPPSSRASPRRPGSKPMGSKRR